ncbi:MAG: hydrogenase expression/formation protein HypE [Pseudobutyrivibrio sp.]|nr:hydrogenase expression/formation protein HypE [Pseudobutyrivibrio sp.]
MDIITTEHGSGGEATSQLINEIFAEAFSNPVLNAMEDAAVVSGGERIAVTTDSFVVTPLEFPGGDIGRLCVCGTVNDLLMRGAVPKYLTCGFILCEGASIAQIKRIVKSMAETAKEAGVMVVAGDTKVVEGKGELYINTTGVGVVPEGVDISAKNAKPGDTIIVSGNMGDHHAAILSQRLSITNNIESDNAPLTEMTLKLIEAGIHVHTLRDVTRGGLATVLKELAVASGTVFEIGEDAIPVKPEVVDFCGLLGLDPMYMGNEGKLVLVVPEEEEEKALNIIWDSKYGQDACIIGQVKEPDVMPAGSLIMTTKIGGLRTLGILKGEGLPRIC